MRTVWLVECRIFEPNECYWQGGRHQSIALSAAFFRFCTTGIGCFSGFAITSRVFAPDLGVVAEIIGCGDLGAAMLRLWGVEEQDRPWI